MQKTKTPIREFAEHLALKEYMHPFMITDKKGNVLCTIGNSEQYFTFQEEQPIRNVIRRAKTGLKEPLSDALAKAVKLNKKVEYNNLCLQQAEGEIRIKLWIKPISKPPAFSNLFIVAIEPEQTPKSQAKNNEINMALQPQSDISDKYVREMEQDLTKTKLHLKSVIQELENYNEELLSSNEEANMTNEEYQTTNRELKTSKLEMQQLNKELMASNRKLKEKIKEVSQINADLNNISTSTQIGILFLDRQHFIKRCTPQMEQIANITKDTIGQKIEAADLSRADADLIANIDQVMNTLTPIEKEVSTDPNHQYWMRILPYQTLESEIQGTVMTFTDITEKNKIHEVIEKKEKKYKLLFENMDDGFILNEAIRNKENEILDFKITEVNPAFEKMMDIEWGNICNKSLSVISPDRKNQREIIETGISVLNGPPVLKEHYFPSIDKYYRIYYFGYEKNFLALLLQDITQLKKDIETQGFIVSIVESSDDAIFRESPEGKILSWNEGAVTLYGYSEKEALGKLAKDLYTYPKNDGDTALIKKVSKGRKIKNHETVHRKKDGSTVNISITKSPIKNADGEIIGISNIVKDITDVKQREEELIHAKKISDQAANLKAAFLANMSHEIRTPLNAIIGFTNLLYESVDTEKQIRYVDIIQHSGKQLLHLIDDLVDVSRIEAGEMPIYKKSVHLNDIMEQIKEQFEGYSNRADRKEINFAVQIPENTNPTIYTDPNRLEQIMVNLLSNAFKFTETGDIEFGYTLRQNQSNGESERAPSELLFYVKDTGRGVPEKHQSIIFDRFKQGGQLAKQVIKGTGLGLAISKGLCHLLGGDIWVESENGKGSVFYFTIPFEETETKASKKQLKNRETLRPPDLSKKTILVAEDDTFSLEMLQHLLRATKAKVHCAEDGEEAMRLFKNNTIDIVLLDIRLPKLNGYEIVKKIRAINKNIPVIAQTAYAMQEEIQKSTEKGFTCYLTKPLGKSELYKTLDQYKDA